MTRINNVFFKLILVFFGKSSRQTKDCCSYNDKKKLLKIFLLYKEIQKESVQVIGSGARKDFVTYEEMREYLVLYEEAV
jgi:hypothetical protein